MMNVLTGEKTGPVEFHPKETKQEILSPEEKPKVNSPQNLTRYVPPEVSEPVRRHIVDLPDTPERMVPISAILSFSLFGLQITDIAEVTGLNINQIADVISSDAYFEYKNRVIQSVIDCHSNGAMQVYKKKRGRAAQVVTNLLDSENEGIALAAARITEEAARENYGGEGGGGLTIRVIKSGPKLDLNVKVG